MGPKRIRVNWRRPALALVGVYVLLAAGIRCFGDRLVFFPQVDSGFQGGPPPDAQEVTFSTADGFRLHGWWAASDGARWTFLVCHGNAGNISGRIELFESLRRCGNVLLFDYRGYGRSAGNPTEEGLYADARAAWEFLTREKGVASASIVAYGQSLGSAVVARLARDWDVGALILEAPFLSVPDMANAILPFPPLGWAMPVKLPTRADVAKVRKPLLVLHGTADTVVPFGHGVGVFRERRSFGRFIRIPGAGHNDLWILHESVMRQAIQAFLSEIGPKPPSPGLH